MVDPAGYANTLKPAPKVDTKPDTKPTPPTNQPISLSPPKRFKNLKLGLSACPTSRALVRRDVTRTNLRTPAFLEASTRLMVPFLDDDDVGGEW